jgi:hypothetical protein
MNSDDKPKVRCRCGGEAEQLAEMDQYEYCAWYIGRVVLYVCDACGLIWDVFEPAGGRRIRPK